MSLYRLFFPPASREFFGKRWLNIALRTLHIVGMIGLGGYLFAVEESAWLPYLLLTLITGVGLMLLYIVSNGIFFIQLRGIAILLKLVLLALIPLTDISAVGLLIAVIIISAVIAHAPGDIRYFSILHGRRIENL
jgi:hypothetical protein